MVVTAKMAILSGQGASYLQHYLYVLTDQCCACGERWEGCREMCVLLFLVFESGALETDATKQAWDVLALSWAWLT